MNGLQTLKQWRTFFDQPTKGILGTMNAMYPVGKIFGVALSAFLGDRFGRKVPLYTGLSILLLGAALQGAAKNLPMFIIARLILGFGTAFIAQTSPILITELAYPTHRGIVTSLYFSTYVSMPDVRYFCPSNLVTDHSTMQYIGAIIAAWTTYGTFRIPNNYAWRIPSILQAAIPFGQICLAWVVPESPRWLVANGRTEQARRVLVTYHGAGDNTSPLVAFELKEIEESIKLERIANSQTSWFDLFKGAANRRRTAIAGIVGFYGSWTGNAVISYYLVLILRTIGIDDTPSQALVNGLLQVFNFLCSVVAGKIEEC